MHKPYQQKDVQCPRDGNKFQQQGELNQKLTKPIIKKITNQYATNFKRSALDVIPMHDDVDGGIAYDDPHHHLCPPGFQSWCFFQHGLALGEEPRKHRTSMRADVILCFL